MRRALALPALALVLAAPACAGGPASLLPLRAGSSWLLRDDSGAQATIAVRRTTAGLTLRGFPGAGTLRVRARGGAVEAYDTTQRRWEPFLRLGAKAGTAYKIDLAQTPMWRSVSARVVSRTLTVYDANGDSHQNCVRLTFFSNVIADAGPEELVFSPGVGFVRIAEQSIRGPQPKLLVRYRVP